VPPFSFWPLGLRDDVYGGLKHTVLWQYRKSIIVRDADQLFSEIFLDRSLKLVKIGRTFTHLLEKP
jgi:hypothetical protein